MRERLARAPASISARDLLAQRRRRRRRSARDAPLLALDRVALAPLLDQLARARSACRRGRRGRACASSPPRSASARRPRARARAPGASPRTRPRRRCRRRARPGSRSVRARSTGSTANCRSQRRRVGVLVVLQHEDHRQPLHRRPVHRLVEVAARGRAVADPGERAARFAAQLEGHRHARRDEHHVGQHRDHPHAAQLAVAEVHVALAPLASRRRRAPCTGRRSASGSTPRTRCAARSRCRTHSRSARAHRERRASRDRLLAEAVVEGARHLALPVQAHRPLLDAPHQEHEAQQRDAVVALRCSPFDRDRRRQRASVTSVAIGLRPFSARRDLRPDRPAPSEYPSAPLTTSYSVVAVITYPH